MADELTLDELRAPEDLERLNVRDFALLAATPATRLDLMKLQLAAATEIRAIVDAFNKYQDEVKKAMQA